MTDFKIDPTLAQGVPHSEVIAELLVAREGIAAAARKIGTVEWQIKVLESATLLKATGSSEGIRKAETMVALDQNDEYKTAVKELEQLRLELASYEARAEAARLITRLLSIQATQDGGE